MGRWHEQHIYQVLQDCVDTPGHNDAVFIIVGLENEILSRREELYRLQLAINQFCQDVQQPKPTQFVDVSHADEPFFRRRVQQDIPDIPQQSLYFARSGDFVKIGRSTHVEKRLSQIQTGAARPIELVAVIEGAGNLEQRVHRSLRHLHSHGEWFHWGDEVLSAVTEFKRIWKREVLRNRSHSHNHSQP